MKNSQILPYSNGECPNCGGSLIGDGYSTALHCEFVDLDFSIGPDAQTIYCGPIKEEN